MWRLLPRTRLCLRFYSYIKNVLNVELEWLDDVVRAKRPKHVPTVLTRDEVKQLLSVMEGTNKLLAFIMHGTWMRLMEVLRLRVLDIDFSYKQIIIRSGKGAKDRHTVLPAKLVKPLQRQIERAALLHNQDLESG